MGIEEEPAGQAQATRVGLLREAAQELVETAAELVLHRGRDVSPDRLRIGRKDRFGDRLLEILANGDTVCGELDHLADGGAVRIARACHRLDEMLVASGLKSKRGGQGAVDTGDVKAANRLERSGRLRALRVLRA